MNTAKNIELELLTKPGCHLCEDARATVGKVAADFGLTFTEVNIEDHPDLRQQHAVEIPVLKINGRVHDFWQINPKRLSRALSKLAGGA
ncbi:MULTISPECIES: glutaredoxin family protein [unclassified Rothia (in: high G+C Gram-positive bacteria)]|uniref:glutaredoxin family protein n=1 Tax=unclassified Rothia (in: high G+C Gram-positive bacteria) TaxID=2689056 RepID=UPI001956B18E|nr:MULTISPECIES: glutaredoxin family protein [unclassified Rothia (in: high G+C Gram-positive bacteria)]MBM7051948.1 glutaredoxin family protein [Rothia sp. ZJ1223]QRZ61984.1 glutaredoxin family protein [Rothia sp. ZJ932]